MIRGERPVFYQVCRATLTSAASMAYHVSVAERKPTNRISRTPAKKQNASGKRPLGILFWIAFVIVIFGLFVINREVIARNMQSTGFLDRFFNREAQPAETPPEMNPEIIERPPSDTLSRDTPPLVVSSGDDRLETHGETANPPQEREPHEGEYLPDREISPPDQHPANLTRDRNLYFIRLDNDGTIVRTPVSRSLPVSDSPMMDVLNVLLQGPNAGERNRGLESLIPEETKILSATVRGKTAYISFSEDFQFNTYGVEGYAAQLRQIVWTVTEFPTISDVQILIEGRRIDYLGEGIWIGSPISREML